MERFKVPSRIFRFLPLSTIIALPTDPSFTLAKSTGAWTLISSKGDEASRNGFRIFEKH